MNHTHQSGVTNQLQFFSVPLTKPRMASAVGTGIAGFFLCGIINHLSEDDFFSSGIGGALLFGILGGYFRETYWIAPSFRELGPDEPEDIMGSDGIPHPNGQTFAGFFKVSSSLLCIMMCKPVGDFFIKNHEVGVLSYTLTWTFITATLALQDWQVMNNRSDYQEIPSEQNTPRGMAYV
ncbi:MAG: hypothetical protein CK424_01765 [Legionella sp.]|nr:MAG: hypothetical protein CK424_01765 [Legionella sp.]